jgi:prepilin-type N-terminal cleavage/methylation domain-containing protein
MPRAKLPMSLSLQRQAGFTLPELLLASVLGAMLLTSLAVTTYGYTRNLDHMEEEAGIAGQDPDPALRLITRDIREAWWVEQVADNHIKLADTEGSFTEYYTEGSALMVKRPNGDEGVMYEPFESIMMEATYMDRYREGPSESHDGVWYSTLDAAGAPGTLSIASGESMALAFTAPVLPGDVPGEDEASEQIVSVQTSVFSLPLAYMAGATEKKVTFTLYESWAPGRAKPTGSSLANTVIDGALIPAASMSGGVYAVPGQMLPVSLSAALKPGVGYTLVISTLGSGNTVVVKKLEQVAFPDDQVAKKASGGSSPFVEQMSIVPFSVSGPWSTTTTVVTPVISMVSITIIPLQRPTQQRSAVVLSQCMTDDPWMGVVPGESAP